MDSFFDKLFKYQRLIFRLLVLTIPILLLIASVNYFIDGAFVFNDRTDKIAKILVSGKNAAIKFVPSNWGGLHSVIVDENIKLRNNSPKDILVFGTSRSSEISSDLFNNKNLFNCVIPGGNILDYIGLYGLYKSTNLLSKYLIISIDPWSFHGRSNVVIKNKSHSIANATATLKVNLNLANNLNIGFDYLEIDKIKIPVINKEDNYIGKIKELFSPSYFQSNVKGGIGKTVFETSNNIEPNYFVIRSDGSYSLQRELLIDSLKVKKKSKDFIEVHKDHFFLESDTLNIYFNYFKKLLLVLKRDNVIPIVYISPINPIVYDKLVKNSVVPIESAIKYFCEMNGILIIGSFNPHKYGIHFSGKKFSDAYHPTKSVVESIFYYHKAELEEIGIISTKESF